MAAPGGIRIVRRRGKARGERGIEVFVIRQVNIDVSLQHAQRVDRFISAGIVDDGQVKSAGPCHIQRRDDMRDELHGRYKVEVGGAFFHQLKKDFGQPLHIDFFSVILMGDPIILAV